MTRLHAPARSLKGLTAILSGLLGLFLADILVRIWLPVPEKGYGVWAAYPGSSLEMESRPDGIRTFHRYNRFGFRGTDFSIVPQNGVRIIAVGDSYTEGTGVSSQETWPAVLSDLLSNGGEVEALNLGDGGSAPERYAQIIAKVAIALQPDHLIVCLIPSDFRRGLRLPSDLSVRKELPDPFRETREGWEKMLVQIFPGLTYLVERSNGKWPLQKGPIWVSYTDQLTEAAVKRTASLEGVSVQQARTIVQGRLARLDPAVVAAARERAFNPAIVRLALSEAWNRRVRTSDMEVPVEELSDGVRRWLAWFGSTAAERGFKPWILYFPQAALVAEGEWDLLPASEYGAPDVVGDTSVRDLLRSQCDDAGIDFIDATPILRQNSGSDLFFRYDTHPKALAHRLVATQVAESLRPALHPHP